MVFGSFWRHVFQPCYGFGCLREVVFCPEVTVKTDQAQLLFRVRPAAACGTLEPLHGGVGICREACAVPVLFVQIILCPRIAGIGRFFQPDSGFFFIFLQADTIEQGQSGDGLCLDVAVSGGYPVPVHGFPVTFDGSPTVRIAVGQPVLGFRQFAPGGLQEPVESLFGVFVGSLSGQIHQAEKVLGGKGRRFRRPFRNGDGGAPVFFAGRPGQVGHASEGIGQRIIFLFRFFRFAFPYRAGIQEIGEVVFGQENGMGPRDGGPGGNGWRTGKQDGGEKRNTQQAGGTETEKRHDFGYGKHGANMTRYGAILTVWNGTVKRWAIPFFPGWRVFGKEMDEVS